MRKYTFISYIFSVNNCFFSLHLHQSKLEQINDELFFFCLYQC
ncbi:hypothetical protein HMPREF1981_02190 [Bacteroides pyogenes F0041]|uniref:Uncharacterized protein n=1 Tax=Bacteroides pyogenes F0041 TaxID=1321819 RepID=U2C2Q8_9BACE|nr:hypothetical protein HMPREF1981_02190 [Bacteroides pyogenes F0041]